jgi:crotonobetaine/carnitine-CoA ligase
MHTVPAAGVPGLAIPDQSLLALLEERARDEPDHVYCLWKDERITLGELDRRIDRMAGMFVGAGVRQGDRVGVMLRNHPDHVVTFFALLKLGAVFVPINHFLKGDSLELLLTDTKPDAIIAEEDHRPALTRLSASVLPALQVWRAPEPAGFTLPHGPGGRIERLRSDDDVLSICFTSGTTGRPKGALVTDRMFRACAVGVGRSADVRRGDVMLLWEPLYHLSGTQILATAVLHPVTLALVERFSATELWQQARRHGVTRLHYLGGILPILLKQPPSDRDRDHPVEIAWGGGCTREAWVAFQERFGVRIREVYGMTENSAITTLNETGKVGSVGRPLPYFDVRILRDDGAPAAVGEMGEIVVRALEPGIITPGYLDNPEATAAAMRNGCFHTGDLGYVDADGDYHYAGRMKDSFRRRGENVSGWEVERVVNAHPDVEESALVGVVNELGDEDLKIVVRPVDGRRPDPADLIRWCIPRMPYFQVPRFVAFTDAFEKTPTQRIRKERIPREVGGVWDLERTELRELLRRSR